MYGISSRSVTGTLGDVHSVIYQNICITLDVMHGSDEYSR